MPDPTIPTIEDDDEDVPDDRDAGASFELVIPKQAASDNVLRFLNRLQEDYGYGIFKEYDGEATTVYSITPAFQEGDDG